MPLDGSRCLHISESTVSISYTFRFEKTSGELDKSRGKKVTEGTGYKFPETK
jgi:hypothetical protein